jgi:palmitoyltransferase ZDHHC5/8
LNRIPNLKDIFGESLTHLIDNYYLFILIYTIHGILFLYVIVNYLIATFMDPGRFPKMNSNEVALDKTAPENVNSTMFKTISINDISVRMKWCTTCQFYRPPRSSHCAICDYCIDVS